MTRRPPPHLLRVLLAAALVAGTLPSPAAAQDAALQGIIASGETGTPLDGALVTLEASGEDARTVVTDRNGFYQIDDIEPGSYILRVRYIGYETRVEPVTLEADERRTVSLRLDPSAMVLEDILVSQERGATVRDLGRQVVTPVDVGRIPVPAGSGDLTSYLQTLPGVTTTGDRGGQLFVRGGTAAENLVLVDGIPIYQPFHILGFFSVFPEDLVSSADFYAGGFGARYEGRTSSVLDVRMRDGDQDGIRTVGSVSPFLVEGIVEGPMEGATWLASFRRSLVEETTGTLVGTTQPLTFESQFVKVSSSLERDNRCSALALRTSDRGRLDPEERQSRVGWTNTLLGLRCVTLQSSGQLLELNLSYSTSASEAVSRGSSALTSSIRRVQHDVHVTRSLWSVPFQAGFHAYVETMDYDLEELFSGQSSDDDAAFGTSAYVEAQLALGSRVEVRPGVVLTATPSNGIEPRVRASWQPFGRSSEVLQGAFGIYRQSVLGTSDLRDVGSVFVAWMTPRDEVPQKAVHGVLGWQQSLGRNLRWSVDGYYKRLSRIPVPVWSGVAQFTTRLGRADGTAYGADARVELNHARGYAYVGYGYGWIEYEAAQSEFADWFGEPVQRYHPPHDRRHQVNAVASVEVGGFDVSGRWQFGSGLPFTRPLGFHDAFDFTGGLRHVDEAPGTPHLLLEKPFTGRLPAMHRLDVSVERDFELSRGDLVVQAGVVNGYDRRNMFYYDLYSGRRVDQLPLAPYASITFRGR